MGNAADTSLKRLLSFSFPLFLAIAALLFPAVARSGSAGIPGETDLTKHPLYSTYRFPHDGSKIHFGTQPLATPEGVIAEVMARDAILKKRLKAMGKEIVFHPFMKGADIAFFTRRGDIDLATVGAVPILSIAATTDIQATAITKLGSAALVTRKAYGNIRALKGKRIGYPDGSTAHMGLLTALAVAGMKESDVRMIPMEVSELLPALEGNRIDALSAFEPTPTAALATHPEFVAIHRFFLAGYLFQTRAFAEREPEAAIEINASYVRSLRWMKKSDRNLDTAVRWTLDAIEKLTRRKPEATAAQIANLVRTDLLRFAESPVMGEGDFRKGEFLHKSFLFLQAQGKLPAEARWERIEAVPNRRILREILAAPAKHQLDGYVSG